MRLSCIDINNSVISWDLYRGSSSNRCNWSLHMVNWEVGGSNSESHGITEVVDSLDKAIGINIAVASSGHPISSLELLFGRKRIAVSIVVLFEVILGMVLRVGSIYISRDNWHNRGGSLDNRSSSLNNRGISLDNRCIICLSLTRLASTILVRIVELTVLGKF